MMLRIKSVYMLLPLFLGLLIAATPVYPQTISATESGSFRIVVVGDTGIGNRAFNAGFDAVQEEMKKENPRLLLHVGDYIYTQAKTPCKNYLIPGVKQKLVDAFKQVVFARGDNDEQPGCWDDIVAANWAKPLNKVDGLLLPPLEGTFELDKVVMIVVLDYDALATAPKQPRDWSMLKKKVKEAQDKGEWVIVAVHIPVVTTSLNEDPYKCCESLKPLYEMGVDLVFSGHRHSFERTYQVKVSDSGLMERIPSKNVNEYKRGDGIVYVVTGGGGARLRPFADLQGSVYAFDHQARIDVKKAVAERAIMNHYVLVELTPNEAIVKTFRVCATGDLRDQLWNFGVREVWAPEGPKLACEGQPAGKSEFDRFKIVTGPAVGQKGQ